MQTMKLPRFGMAVCCLVCVALLFGCDADVTRTADNQTTPIVNVSTGVASAPDFTSANFQSNVINSSKVVLVDCWASW